MSNLTLSSGDYIFPTRNNLDPNTVVNVVIIVVVVVVVAVVVVVVVVVVVLLFSDTANHSDKHCSAGHAAQHSNNLRRM